ncbi:MAG TPA: peptidoglycan DD-metalloendopeptidase family protein [Xanthobacteraceae bacterium]
MSPFLVVVRRAMLAGLGVLPLGLIATAAPSPRGRPPAPAETSQPAPPPASLDTLKERDQELERLRTEQRRTLENEARLKREIESIGDDRRKFNQQIIETASRVVAVEERIAQTQERLEALDDKERALRTSLEQRRDLIAEVLAALQRIGRQPPPGLMIAAEDALQSVRSAMILGAVLPEMRHQAEVLAADLTELLSLRKQMTDQRGQLARDLFVLADERQRLSLFIDERQRRQAEAEQALTAERQRAGQLARQAENLNQLIVKLEQGLDTASRAARAAVRASENRKALAARPDLAALRDPGRLTPAVAFASAKGMLPLPVKGARIKEFGAPDGLGGTEKGLSIAARPGGQITAPCDGWVVYAGVFRNYGQLLILNAGDGYHVLLAGMERISVDLGQFVLTGEPVAVMGGAQSAAVKAGAASQPVLYVEFRKDGVPVDPGPWWAANEGQKVRG